MTAAGHAIALRLVGWREMRRYFNLSPNVLAVINAPKVYTFVIWKHGMSARAGIYRGITALDHGCLLRAIAFMRKIAETNSPLVNRRVLRELPSVDPPPFLFGDADVSRDDRARRW